MITEEDKATRKARLVRKLLGENGTEDIESASNFDYGVEGIPSEVSKYQCLFKETKKSNPEWIYVDSPGRKVFRTHNTVVKFGSDLSSREAETMQFIKQATSIPVPDASVDGPNAIVMNYVEGDNLEQCWVHLSPEEQMGFAEQMRDILQQLDALRGDYIGAVNRGPAIDRRRSIRTGGPFETESEFNDFLLSEMSSASPLLHREAMEVAMKRRYDIVFSHCDLNLHNVIVKEGKIVALLDWETAGWYPKYWEYVKFCFASCHEKGWHGLGHTIFPITYPKELVRDQYYGLFVL